MYCSAIFIISSALQNTKTFNFALLTFNLSVAYDYPIRGNKF